MYTYRPNDALLLRQKLDQRSVKPLVLYFDDDLSMVELAVGMRRVRFIIK
jgi:predicted DNA-binding protein YlxM (UPF0122 family)